MGFARHLPVLLAAALVVALPFVFRREPPAGAWRPGDPVLTIVSPHNEAIRHEFGRGFSRWHEERYGQPVKVDWRAIGGTTEIMRYLESEYTAAFRAWWTGPDRAWDSGLALALTDRRLPLDAPPEGADPARWEARRDVRAAFLATDDPRRFGSRIDLFFGGGEFDHSRAASTGLTVPPWPPGERPEHLFTDERGRTLIPQTLSGERWWSDTFFGNAVSSFGICSNLDRLADLGLPPPTRWSDLADPGYAGALGVADPTKSGSVAKAFEMLIHEQVREAVRAAGFGDAEVESLEAAIGRGGIEAAPEAYHQAIRDGWLQGVRLVQRLGANARYFTDSAGKVPIDVAQGAAAAGLAIDFYARFQAQVSRRADGTERMAYLTPVGGSSVSADPISLLRGAPDRELAVRFIEYVLSEEGQKLWTYRPGTPGGPERYALRRLPVRRDFYPSDDPEFQARHEEHARHAGDDLADPVVNPFALAEHFTYVPRWTGRHFGVQRDLVRAMCLDAGEELRAAWAAIRAAGGPDAVPEAMAALTRMPDRPEPLVWDTAPGLAARHGRFELLETWNRFFRGQYREARRLAEAGR